MPRRNAPARDMRPGPHAGQGPGVLPYAACAVSPRRHARWCLSRRAAARAPGPAWQPLPTPKPATTAQPSQPAGQSNPSGGAIAHRACSTSPAVLAPPAPDLTAIRVAEHGAYDQAVFQFANGIWTAPGSLEAVTSGKVGAHGIQEAASR